MGYEDIRAAVRGLYDIQKLRIQAGNRLVAHYMSKLGVEPSKKPPKWVDDLKKQLKREHKLVTNGLLEHRDLGKVLRQSSGGLISSHAEYVLVDTYFTLYNNEQKNVRLLEQQLMGVPIYSEWLRHVKGVGPMMGGVIVSEFDIRKARHPSSLWRYAGLDVVELEDGTTVGRSGRRECLVEVEYVAKDGSVKTRLSLGYSRFLKSKLVEVLATSFLRCGSPYAQLYYNYRHRIEGMERHKDKTRGHIDRMSKRYMIKIFLIELYVAWRRLEGLPTSKPYHVAKQGGREHEFIYAPPV